MGVEQLPKETHEGVISSLTGVMRYHTLWIKGIIHGKKVNLLIDGGASNDFIDAEFEARRGLTTDGGFTALILGKKEKNHMSCTKIVPNMSLTMGNYIVTDNFFVVDCLDSHVVLGVQWLYSIGTHITNYQEIEYGFTGPYGKKVMQRGIH